MKPVASTVVQIASPVVILLIRPQTSVASSSRLAYFHGANDPFKSLKTTLRAEINQEAWETLHSDTSRPFAKPKSGRIAVRVINHLGDEVMKVFRV